MTAALTNWLPLLAIGLLLSGCGGGGSSGGTGGGTGGTGGGGNTGPQLTSAATYGEFVDLIKTRYPGVLDYFALVTLYDNALEAFPGYMAATNLNKNPIAGTWKHYAQLDYPASNGKLEFVDTGSGSRRLQYRDLDLVNNSIANGGAQAFWGVFPPDADFDLRAFKEIWVSILAEVIVQDAARVPQYRALKTWAGFLPNYTSDNPYILSPPSDGIIGNLFIGNYRLTVLECFVVNCVEGTILEYSNYMDRQP